MKQSFGETASSFHQWFLRVLPEFGVYAFSMGSVNGIANFFQDNAQHQSGLYWVAAFFVELVTAWLVKGWVEQVWMLTRSKSTKQDRRFARIILIVYVACTLPTFIHSIFANFNEFSNLFLASVFPTLAIACAFGGKVPEIVRDARKATETAKETSAAQSYQSAARRKRLDDLGHLSDAYQYIVGNGGCTAGDVAVAIGKTGRTARLHVAQLVEQGLVRRNGDGVEVAK